MFGELPLLCFYFLNLELLIAYTIKLKEVQEEILHFKQDLTSSIWNGILKRSQNLCYSVGILFSYEQQNLPICIYRYIHNHLHHMYTHLYVYVHLYVCMYIVYIIKVCVKVCSKEVLKTEITSYFAYHQVTQNSPINGEFNWFLWLNFQIPF